MLAGRMDNDFLAVHHVDAAAFVHGGVMRRDASCEVAEGVLPDTGVYDVVMNGCAVISKGVESSSRTAL